MLWSTRTGIFLKVLLNSSYKVINLTRRHVDCGRRYIISLVNHEEFDALACILEAFHRELIASLSYKLKAYTFVCIESKCQAFMAKLNRSAAYYGKSLAEIVTVRGSASARKIQE